MPVISLQSRFDTSRFDTHLSRFVTNISQFDTTQVISIQTVSCVCITVKAAEVFSSLMD